MVGPTNDSGWTYVFPLLAARCALGVYIHLHGTESNSKQVLFTQFYFIVPTVSQEVEFTKALNKISSFKLSFKMCDKSELNLPFY